jgi:hypothetical protein
MRFFVKPNFELARSAERFHSGIATLPEEVFTLSPGIDCRLIGGGFLLIM